MSLALEKLRETFASEILATHSDFGDDTAIVRRERIVTILTFLRDDPDLRFDFAMFLTGVDYIGEEPRFEVVYHLYSLEKKHRVRIRAKLPEEDPAIDSAVVGLAHPQLVRAGGVRHVRDRLPRAPESHAHPDERGVRRAPPAEGLPEERTAAHDRPEGGRRFCRTRPGNEAEAAESSTSTPSRCSSTSARRIPPRTRPSGSGPSSTGRRSSTSSRSSATFTAASRRSRKRPPGRRSSRTPTG